MVVDTKTINAILPHLVNWEGPEVDPYHVCAEFFQAELEGACGELVARMTAHPHMVPGLRQALQNTLDEARESAQSSFCSQADLDSFLKQVNTFGWDSDGAFSQEAKALIRAQNLAQRPSSPPARPRHRP